MKRWKLGAPPAARSCCPDFLPGTGRLRCGGDPAMYFVRGPARGSVLRWPKTFAARLSNLRGTLFALFAIGFGVFTPGGVAATAAPAG